MSTLGFLIAVSAGLLLPGSASAETADPALAGSCAGTLQDGSGEALTVDAGAPVNAPGAVTVGTGSDSANQPLVSLPVADTVKALNVGDLPVVGDTVTDVVCPGAQNTVNALSATTQSVLAGEQLDPPPSTPPSTPPPSTPPAPVRPAPQPPANPAPAPGQPGTTPGSATNVVFPVLVSNPLGSTLPAPAISAIIPPGGVAPAAPGLNPPVSATPPEVIAQNSGTAEALPASSNTPARLPLLLAVLALAVAAAALVRSWMRRKNA